MTCEQVVERLDEYVDGELPAATAEQLAQHLQTCQSCREEERALRQLVARAAGLPREIQPAKDLWAGIAERLEGHKVVEFPRRRLSSPRPRESVVLAAAAAALVAVSSAVTAYLMRGPDPTPADRAAVSLEAPLYDAELVQASIRGAETEYERAAEALLASLEARQDSLSPETMKVVRDNLAVIDNALREVRAALRKDPGNPGLVRMLASTHRKKIDILQRVAKHPTSL
jgi:hypothetical protein